MTLQRRRSQLGDLGLPIEQLVKQNQQTTASSTTTSSTPQLDPSIARRMEQPVTQPTQVDTSITRAKTQQQLIIEQLQQANREASSDANKIQAFKRTEANISAQSNKGAEQKAIESFDGGKKPTSYEEYKGYIINKHAGGKSQKYMFVAVKKKIPSLMGIFQGLGKALDTMPHSGSGQTQSSASTSTTSGKWSYEGMKPTDGSIEKVIKSSGWVSVSAEMKTWIDSQQTGYVKPPETTFATAFNNKTEVAEAYIKNQPNRLSDGQNVISAASAKKVLRESFAMDPSEIEAFLTSAVFASLKANKLHYTDLYNKLDLDFGWSNNDIEGAIEYELDVSADYYDEHSWLDKIEMPSNISLPLNLSDPTKSNQEIPTDRDGRKLHYWSGDLDDHHWGTHGFNGDTETSANNDSDLNANPLPKIMVDSLGCYGMAMAHYRADFDNTTGEFFGWVPLKKNQTVAAGTPICSVMQHFTKPVDVLTKYLKVWDVFYLKSSPKPGWVHAAGMDLTPENFYFLEPALATENPIPIQNEVNDGMFGKGHLVLQYYGKNPPTDMTQIKLKDSIFNVGAIPSYITKKDREQVQSDSSVLKKISSMQTLDRDFSTGKKIAYGLDEMKDKSAYACKLEWYHQGGWSDFRPHPTHIPNCNAEGKTMVIYRFPRQLDPVNPYDATEISAITNANGPNYSLNNTKHCYPYPREGTGGYALIGRLQPGNSKDTSYTAAKYEVNMPDGEVFGGRRKIDLVPMVSPQTHPMSGYRVNDSIAKHSNSGSAYEWLPNDFMRMQLMRANGRFCFDTTKAGLQMSVADPIKTAYFNNPNINSTYFVKNDMKPGSTFFVIGQGLTPYDSIDSQLRNGEAHASERISLSIGGRKSIQDLHNMDIRSHQITPRGILDGTLASTKVADFIVPAAVITTLDLARGTFVPGLNTIKDTFKKISKGKDFTPEIFKELNVPGKNIQGRSNNKNMTNPLFYDVEYEGQIFSYPYSIAGFTVPPYWKGPSLERDADGNVIEDKRASIKEGTNLYFNFYPPFGEAIKKEVDIYEEVETQPGGYDPETGEAVGDPLVVLEDEFGDDPVNVTMDELQDDIEVGVQQSLVNDWLDDHANTRYVIPGSYENYFVGGDDYMTGSEIVEANSGQVPSSIRGMDPRQFGGLGRIVGNDPMYVVEDVTEKWGELGHLGNTRDIRMQITPPYRDVEQESLDFMAMESLDGIGSDDMGSLSSWMLNTLPDVGTASGQTATNFIQEIDVGIGDWDAVVVAGVFAGIVTFALTAGAGVGAGAFTKGALTGIGRGGNALITGN